MTLKEWEADVLKKPGAEGRVEAIEAGMRVRVVHSEDCDLDEDCSCRPKRVQTTLRRFGHGDLRPRPRACFVQDCDEKVLPSSGRYCKAHFRASEAWLAEERRLDNTEDGRRGWYLEWENGWDGGVTESEIQWDDPEALSEELVGAS